MPDLSLSPPPSLSPSPLPADVGVCIAVLSDRPIVRAGLRAALTAETGTVAVLVGADHPDDTGAPPPDVVLLDLAGPHPDLVALRRLAGGGLPVVALAAGDRQDVVELLVGHAGVVCAPLSIEPAVLLDLAATLARGRRPARTRRAVQADAGPDAALSDREERVLLRVALGLSDRQIAAELDLRPATVTTAVRVASRKIGADRRSHVGLWVLRRELVR